MPFKVVGRGYVEYNDEKQVFERTAEFPMDDSAPFTPRAGASFLRTENGVEYYYFCREVPGVRIPNNYEALNDFHAGEVFTCLKEGERFDNKAEQLDRDESGKIALCVEEERAALQLHPAGAVDPGRPHQARRAAVSIH